MIKKILLTLASVFLIWQSQDLISHIDALKGNSWIVLFLIAWVINMYITGIFAFASFAYPTHKLLPKKYYEIHSPDKLNKTYKLLKVSLFKQFLLATLWKRQKKRKNYFDGKKSGILSFSENSMKAEFGHLMPFLIINIVCVYLILIDMPVLAFFSALWNIIGNLYPIILQRHHRMRIMNLSRRQQSI